MCRTRREEGPTSLAGVGWPWGSEKRIEVGDDTLNQRLSWIKREPQFQCDRGNGACRSGSRKLEGLSDDPFSMKERVRSLRMMK